MIDLVVVVAVLGVLCSVLLPRMAILRTEARTTVCLDNCKRIVVAGQRYAADNRQMFPGGVVHDRRVMGNNLLGKTGRQAWLPGAVNANHRALVDYLDDPWNTANCPMDAGTQDTKDYLAHVYYGTSYLYFERTQNDLARRNKVGLNGVWAIEGHHASEVTQPDRKLFIADEVILARHGFNRKQHRWHTGDAPLTVGIGFVDGHAANLPRHEGTEEGELAWPAEARVISDAIIKTWAATRTYY